MITIPIPPISTKRKTSLTWHIEHLSPDKWNTKLQRYMALEI